MRRIDPHAMSSTYPFLRLCARACALLLLTACAQSRLTTTPVQSRQDPGLSQAQRQAMGRDTGRASAQLQLSLDNDAAPPATVDPVDDPIVRELAQAKTFLGTIPCQSTTCETSRISLTLAPSGHWRARSTTLTVPPHDTAEQGCWEVVNFKPLRIILLTETEVIRANLGFVQDNVLRVLSYNGVQPLLEYRLTQQAEIDPIDELEGHALADCRLPTQQ